MNKQVVKFLEFRGKNLVYLCENSTYWIAVKPVCEALNIDYLRQYKNLREDVLLRPSLSILTMMIPGDKQPRKYVCLPEEMIYGWIFSIRRDNNEALQEYKIECYHVLYNHFHGIITRRRELIREKADADFKRRKLENALSQNKEYNEYTKLKLCDRRLNRKLKEIEQSEMQEELELYSPKDNH